MFSRLVSQRTLRSVWRLLLALLVVGCFGFVLFTYYGASGEFRVSYDFADKATVVSEFTPTGRSLDREQNLENGGAYQRIVAEPVYFTVDLPSAYPTATVELEYQNPSQPTVELGLQTRLESEQPVYDFKTIQNKFVEQSTWDRLEEDGVVLLQADQTYDSVAAFKANPPKKAQVGTWRAGLELPFTFAQYQEGPEVSEWNYPLRGGHEFYTYVKDVPLEFTITYEDANLSAGPDPVQVEVIRLGAVIHEELVADDGTEGVTSSSTGPQQVQVNLPDLEEGVYAVRVQAGEDIFLTGVTTPLDKLVVKHNVHLAGSPEYHNALPQLSTERSTLYTESDVVSATAKHSPGVSTITLNGEPLYIHTVDRLYRWQTPRSRQFTEVIVPTNDVLLQADHYFSASEDSWFDPQFGFRELTSSTDASVLDYIIAKSYTEPGSQRNWVLTSTEFDLTQVAAEDPTQLQFIVSAPGLADASRDIKVRRITVTAQKEPVTLSNVWQRLKAKLGM